MAHVRTFLARQSFPWRLRLRAEREGLFTVVHEVVREHSQALSARLDEGWRARSWGNGYSLWKHVPEPTRQVLSDVEVRVSCALLDGHDDNAVDASALPDSLSLTFTVEQTERASFPEEPAGFGVVLTLLSMPAILFLWWRVGGPLSVWQFFSWLALIVVCVWAESRARDMLEAWRIPRTPPARPLVHWPLRYMVLQALFALVWMGVSVGAGLLAHRTTGYTFAIPLAQGLGFGSSVRLLRWLRGAPRVHGFERETTHEYEHALRELEAYLDDARVPLERAS